MNHTRRVKMHPVPRLRGWPRVPRALVLAGGRVKIRVVRGPRMHEATTGKRRAVLGYFDSATRTIVLDSALPPAQRWMTLFHELTHVALFDAHADTGLRMVQEEGICDAIGLALMHALRYARRMAA